MVGTSSPRNTGSIILQREIAARKGADRNFEIDFTKKEFCQKDVREHTGCVNSLQFSHGERYLASGGDDGEVRIWSIDEMIMKRAPKPRVKMLTRHQTNIFSLAFDLNNKFLYSGDRNGFIFKHDIETKQLVYESDKFANNGDVYHLHQNPTDNNLVVATRSQKVAILDDRDRPNPQPLRVRELGSFLYTAEFHPTTPRLLLTNSKNRGPNVYDLRSLGKPIYDRAMFVGSPDNQHQWMGSMWSPSGNQYLTIRNRGCPVFYDLISQRCFYLLGEYYLNQKTIKSMTFIDDYTVATGSDHWGIHVWKIPRPEDSGGFEQQAGNPGLAIGSELAVLKGHRSVPNQVRFSPQNQILVSSGVEKIIKIWSDRFLPWSYDIPFERHRSEEYVGGSDNEFRRERNDRMMLEEELKLRGEMEGRAGWDDIFGGDIETREDRETLEIFDITHVVPTTDDSSDDEDAFDAVRRRLPFIYRDPNIDINNQVRPDWNDLPAHHLYREMVANNQVDDDELNQLVHRIIHEDSDADSGSDADSEGEDEEEVEERENEEEEEEEEEHDEEGDSESMGSTDDSEAEEDFDHRRHNDDDDDMEEVDVVGIEEGAVEIVREDVHALVQNYASSDDANAAEEEEDDVVDVIGD